MPVWTINAGMRGAVRVAAAATLVLAAAAAAEARRFEPGDAGPPALPTRISVLDRSVVIAAPEGWCIDTGASANGGTVAFVLLASCRALSGNPADPGPARPGLLTASIGTREAAALPTPGELDRYFASPRGRATLSRQGDQAAVTPGPSYALEGAFYIHAREDDADPTTGAHSWRAIFAVNSRLVTVTLRDLPGQPISDDEAFATVEGFAERIIAASRGRSPGGE